MWTSQPEWVRRACLILGVIIGGWIIFGTLSGYPFTAMFTSTIKDLLTTTPGLIVLAILIAGSVLFSRASIKQRDIKASKPQPVPAADLNGYRPPVEWSETVRSTNGMTTGIHQMMTGQHRLQRSRMAPFMLWYFGEHYATNGEKGWVNVVDGNPKLEAQTPLPNYIQVVRLTAPSEYARTLALFSVTPEVAASLNQGPRRQGKIRGVLHPEGQSLDLTLIVGEAGASFPASAMPPSGDFGTSRELDEDDLRRAGVM